MSILLCALVLVLALGFSDATITSLFKNYGYAPYSGAVAILLWALFVALVEGLFYA
jgi:hypothetical protein